MADVNDSRYTPEQEGVPAEKPAEEKPVHQWQQTKEKWYDHLNITVKQLDTIIYCALGALAVVFVLIALDALDIIG